VYLEYQRFLSAQGRVVEAERLAAELRRLYPASPEAGLLAGSKEGASPDDPSSAITYASSPLRLLPPGILSLPQEPSVESPGGPPEARPQGPPVAPARASAAAPTAAAPSAPAPSAPAQASAAAPSAAAPSAPAPAATPQPAAAPAPKALVQTGSFRDPENAQYMVRDLKAAGFGAEISEKQLDGKKFYRVVIGPAMAPEEAQQLMLRLKVAGFEGFLLFLD
ncbi:MAG: SPOR domain-containing protein, partial [Spirochaetales bacterium]|nr:SPOR domain-containing protein [Spirochaetales bacterium]